MLFPEEITCGLKDSVVKAVKLTLRDILSLLTADSSVLQKHKTTTDWERSFSRSAFPSFLQVLSAMR